MRKSRDSAEIAALSKQINRRSGSGSLAMCPKKRTVNLNRPKGPIYFVLQEDLIDSGCPIAARFMGDLVNKENDLIQADLKFQKRVRDARSLLFAIVENVKTAEGAFQMCGDKELILKLLLQTVHMIQVQDDAYRWLVKEFYSIILKISRGWDEECAETLARTRFEFGVVLTEIKDNYLNEAIIELSRSLEACKGTMWYTNDRDRNILVEDVCVHLCETLLRQAKIDSRTNPKKAADLAHRAVRTIVEVGISSNKILFCNAKLRKSEYMIADSNYEGAMKVLNNLQSHIMATAVPKLKCEFYLCMGICHYFLSPHAMALRKFKLALVLSESYHLAELKANILMYLGKIHAQNRATEAQARQCYIEAKDLFQSLGDFENEKLAKFLMAKLRAYQIFPNYLELMKRSTYTGFCYLFDLIQWKQKMIPFWNNQGELHEHENVYQCLLDEEVGKELHTKTD